MQHVDLQPLQEAAEELLSLNQRMGNRDIQITISEHRGLRLNTRQGKVVSRLREHRTGLTINVFDGHKRGVVNSAALSKNALKESLIAAYGIADVIGEDPALGLADPALFGSARELNLYHSWELSDENALEYARRIESALEACGPELQSNGASINTTDSHFLLANSRGFCQSSSQSMHAMSVSALARNERHSELEFDVTVSRLAADFDHVEQIGESAGKRALSYLDQAKISSVRCPVLFDNRSAVSLLMHLSSAVSGTSLYMETSFLKDAFGRRVMPEHLSLQERPFEAGALASFGFDSDGIAPSERFIVEQGQLTGQFLSLYAARRLNATPTGNGFGPGNLYLSSGNGTLSFQQMLKNLDTGFWVTSLVGDGVNLMTGDYSRSARGFWVEKGQIKHAVTGVTLSGDLNEMLANVVALGSDTFTQGPFNCGSLLIEQMQLSA